MFDLRRELCRSNVFCAEKGDGRTKYLVFFFCNFSHEKKANGCNQNLKKRN